MSCEPGSSSSAESCEPSSSDSPENCEPGSSGSSDLYSTDLYCTSESEERDVTPEVIIDPVAFYNSEALVYRTSKLEINRSRWIKRTVERYSGWIGFASMGHHITVLDYCAGTGFLSQALAPYVHRIIGIDNAQHMALEYDLNAEIDGSCNPHCEMRALWGNLLEDNPDDEVGSMGQETFDLVAMTLGINFFGKRCPEALKRNLRVLLSRLKVNGTLLLLEMQKDHHEQRIENPSSRDEDEIVSTGLTRDCLGSEEVRTALLALGMEQITVVQNNNLLFHYEEMDDGELDTRDEMYYLLKAKKGLAYREHADEHVS